MSLLVVGTVALDSVKTPFGNVDNALGGSATYFSTSASYFADVRLVAVVGEVIFHLQDENLTLVEARSLQKHLKKTEDKRAIKNHTPSGYEVWWSK